MLMPVLRQGLRLNDLHLLEPHEHVRLFGFGQRVIRVIREWAHTAQHLWLSSEVDVTQYVVYEISLRHQNGPMVVH